MRLAIVTTHPIQYNAPWFNLLAQEEGIELKVFYTWEASQTIAKYDPDFGRVIEWDIPLLNGYDYAFVKNVSDNQGSHHYKGIDNPTLNKEIEAWGATAVLVFGWPFKSHLACIRYFKGKIPVLFRGDSTLIDETPGIKRVLRRLFLRYVYSHIDYAFYVGTNNKQYFTAHGLKGNQLIYAPHAIDNDRFSLNEDVYELKARNWKVELGITEDCFTILFAGKFEHKKNPGFLLELAAWMPESNMRFILVGNGELEGDLKNIALADNRIIFIGFQNQQNMPVVYRLANVFVLPSIGPGETWGLAINEAMACGKPIISTDKTGGAIDLINNNGIIMNSNNANSIVQYLKSLITDKELYLQQCQLSKKAIENFSYQKIVNNIASFLRTL